MVFIVLLFPLALLAMTTLMDAVEDLLSSLMTPARRHGLARAAQTRRRSMSAVRAVGEAAPLSPAGAPWAVREPMWPLAAPQPPAAPSALPVDRRPVPPAEYDAPTAQAAGWY
ncbi:hypothetical protein [Parafrankia sp. EUN1f]|uniref:hypothetical protein n=1 Tax=Parafrankia sp. EUN1f TaxID=102897 RepID=UPI0005680D8A|nr:hypothetical protein [Parafrankia sp. EUN1f]